MGERLAEWRRMRRDNKRAEGREKRKRYMFGEGLRGGRRNELLEFVVVFGLSEKNDELLIDPRSESVRACDRLVTSTVTTQNGGERLERAELRENGVRVLEESQKSEQFDGEIERTTLHSAEHASKIGLESILKRCI